MTTPCHPSGTNPPLSAYAPAIRCPVLTERMAYAPAMRSPGTEQAYALSAFALAMACPVLT
eukprot:1247866-Rhodomonas_salina.1